MKPLNREEVLHKEGNGTPSNKSVISHQRKLKKKSLVEGSQQFMARKSLLVKLRKIRKTRKKLLAYL
ncbi:MAG: hypothetical protein N4S00_04350 [Lactobacillus crispatus]|nr:hypothetical protein [Lactobacillus crispatus]